MFSDESDFLPHGGKLKKAALEYNIPLPQWLDLSTGINPKGWRVPQLPEETWTRLPEDEDGLSESASAYYGAENSLSLPGSQAAIQNLPLLKPKSVVGIIQPTYNEHAHAWQKLGHDIIKIPIENSTLIIDEIIETLDVLILINPNNPTGEQFPTKKLIAWHTKIQEKHGWLIIDEAFIDTTPEQSLVPQSHKPGLIILRSLGKFFGLPGARVGFVFAEEIILSKLKYLLGPWTVATPSRWVAEQALLDKNWQVENRSFLIRQSNKLRNTLTKNHLTISGSCSLFLWVKHENSQRLHVALAKQGVLTRLFTEPNSLRFGLPKSDAELSRLGQALSQALQETSSEVVT